LLSAPAFPFLALLAAAGFLVDLAELAALAEVALYTKISSRYIKLTQV